MLARARPGQLNYASSGTGTAGHLAGELFKALAQVNYQHIPYKGGGPAVMDVLSGTMDTNHCVLNFTRKGDRS